MTELFLFVRPPRALWPFNGPSTAFWPPLAFASLAAALRESFRDLDVRILDCCATQTGWKTLSAGLSRLSPRYVAIGEEAVSAAEGLRLARIARSLGASVIAGGCTFGNLASETLSSGLVDVVVRGEGERTLVDVVRALREPSPSDALAHVPGIAFARDGQIVITPPRPLIADLDDLPMPAWDLLPMAEYGKGSRNHPGLATIEHSRGCVGSCAFCVLWRQMADLDSGVPRARYRTKSPSRVLDEIRLLTRRFGRRYLCWVDPCFNADETFLRGLAEGMRRDGLTVGQSAWVRSDCLLRDERSGLLGELVDSGLNEVFVGIERADSDGLAALGRPRDGAAREVLPLVARRHPSLYLVGSFIYGLPGDSWRTVKAMRDETVGLGLDMAFYIPLTALPGTGLHGADGDGAGEGLSHMNFLTPTDRRARTLARLLALSFFLDLRPRRVAYTLRTLFSPDPRKRRMNRRLFARGASFALRLLASAPSSNGNGVMRRPAWYDD